MSATIKPFLFTLATCVVFAACTNRKQEEKPVDRTSSQPRLEAEGDSLAFAESETVYHLNDSAKQTDSIDFFLFANEDELRAVASTTAASTSPDFIINYIVGIATRTGESELFVKVTSVKIMDNAIKVFAEVEHDSVNLATTPQLRVFAIERRDGIISIDFYLENRLRKSLLLPIG